MKAGQMEKALQEAKEAALLGLLEFVTVAAIRREAKEAALLALPEFVRVAPMRRRRHLTI